MKFLIGDIGNTLTKICIFDLNKSNISEIKSFNTKKISNTKYVKSNFKFLKKNKVSKSLFASVVPKTYQNFKKILNRVYKIKSNEISENFLLPIKINLKNKKNVGSDRLANAVAAFKKYKMNCIVVDFGTATTFDVVKKEGIYDGGIIVPGIDVSIKSIYNTTAKLPIIKLKKTKIVVGKNTKEALVSGFFWGYSGIISNLIKKMNNLQMKI
jgi:pantothenate kinase, type III